MKAKAMIELTDDMPLAQALWWFIENKPDTPDGTELFFHLRERMRNYAPSLVITGNPVDGLFYYGPFDTEGDGVAWAEAEHDGQDWWCAKLADPQADVLEG